MLSFKGDVDHALARMKSASAPPVRTGNRPARRQTLAQSQVIYSQPQFYSPLHTPQNWQIPSRRHEVYMWSRYFADNEPKVAAAIDFYSNFPMNGFETQCSDTRVKRFFDFWCKRANMDQVNKWISKEIHMMGDAFPFAELSCKHCMGTGITRSGKPCDHKGAIFDRVVVLNPDWIDIQANPFSNQKVITMRPDEELKRVVWSRQPIEIYERIPAHLRSLILASRPIPLSDVSISHLAYNASPYGGGYGTSLIRRLFKCLTYKDKLMTAQWIIAERLILPIRIVKVGESDRPAGPADIADVQAQLASVAQDPNLTLVTHHAVDYDWVGTSGKVLQLSNEYELLNKEILQGLMLNEALLSGEMSGYQSAAIGAESIIRRLESWRLDLGGWIEERLFKPMALWMGFIDEQATKEYGEDLGEIQVIYPKIKWNDLNLRDDTQEKQTLMQLHERQVVSTQTLLERFDLDYDQEIERIRFETAAQHFGQMGQAGGGGAPGGGGMDLGLGGGAPAGGGMDLGLGDMGGAPGAEMGDIGGAGGMEMGGAPEMDMGGAPPGGAAAAASIGGTAGKILTKSRAKDAVKQASETLPPEEQAVQPSGVRLTSLEQIMYKTLESMSIPFTKFAQYPLGPYRVDFAIPSLKLAIECDGQKWHSEPTDKASDEIRDQRLAGAGWTVIRFGETDLKERLNDVRKSLAQQIHKNWQHAIQVQEQARKRMLSAGNDIEALLKVSTNQSETESARPDGITESSDDGKADQG